MRKTVVLEQLAALDEPVRAIVLWRECNRDARFRKASGEEFWAQDFADFMKGLVAQGVVAKLESRHRVWYVVTEKGILTLGNNKTRAIVVGNIRRRLKFWLRQWMEYAVYKDTQLRQEQFQELTNKVDKLTKLLGNDGENVAKQLRYRILVENYADHREDSYHHEERLIELQKMETLVPLDDKLRGRMESDVAKFTIRRRAAEERQMRMLEEESAKRIHCFKCNSWVMRKETIDLVGKLKEHFKGLEVAAVCCSCYDKLMKGDEQLPGEIVQLGER